MPNSRIFRFILGVVGERGMRLEAADASRGGAHAGDDADMSNEKPGGNPGRRNPKVSRGRFVRPGSAGA